MCSTLGGLRPARITIRVIWVFAAPGRVEMYNWSNIGQTSINQRIPNCVNSRKHWFWNVCVCVCVRMLCDLPSILLSVWQVGRASSCDMNLSAPKFEGKNHRFHSISRNFYWCMLCFESLAIVYFQYILAL